jgi:hypothetical protein
MKSANASPRVLPFAPAVSEPIQCSTEAPAPYAPRVVRALVVLLGAVSLHVWGIPAPYPQQMPVAAFLSRLMRPPRVPLAPPLELPGALGPSAVSGRSVVVENRLIRVAPLPPVGISPRTLRAEQLAMPLGTSGRLAGITLPNASPVPAVLPAATPAPVERAAMKLADVTDFAAVPAEASAPQPPAADPIVGHASGGARVEPAGRPAESRPAGAVASLPDNERAQNDQAQKEEDVVLAVLKEYSRAYGQMDVRATKAVYPTVDDRSLRRAFEDLKEQQLRFASCGVSISSSGAGASAWCTGDATYRPKIGSRMHLPNREWTFTLERDGAGWQILKASMKASMP